MPSQYPPTARTAIGLTCRKWPGRVFSYADDSFWNKNEQFSYVDIEKFAIEYVVSTKGSRMQALAAVNSGFAVKGAIDAVQGAGAAGAVGLTIAVSLGSSKSQSNTDASANTAKASTVKAGGNVTITATGADNTKGETSNITIQGSQIQAGQTTTLDAQDNLNLLASQNTTTQSNSSSNSSSSVGVSFGIGAGTTGVGFNIAAARGKGAGAGKEVTYNNTLIEGNTVNLRSGKDTNLIGAVVKGTTVNADIGGNLRIESLQDTSVYHETSKNSGGTLSISAAGVPGGSVTSGRTKIDSNFVSVGQQSAIRAGGDAGPFGSGGFNVNVAGKTDLVGGQITSTQKAVDDNKNSFETKGPLTVTNLENAATYSATGSSVTVGVGSELASSGAGAGRATGNANSTTEAAITGVAGNKTARTGDKEAGLQPIFNLEAVKLDVATQIEITKKFGQNASKAVGDFAAEQLKKAQDSGDQAEIDKWKEGGIARVALHTLVGALGGGVGGAVGAATSQTVIPLLGEQIAQLDIPVELKQVLVQVAAVAVGAATGGTAGVAAAVNATGQNYLTHTELKSRAQNDSACKKGDAKACDAVRELDKKSVERNAVIRDGVTVATGAQADKILTDMQTTMSGLASYKGELQAQLEKTSDPAQRAELQTQINQADSSMKQVANLGKDYHFEQYRLTGDKNHLTAFVQLNTATNGNELADAMMTSVAAFGSSNKGPKPTAKPGESPEASGPATVGKPPGATTEPAVRTPAVGDPTGANGVRGEITILPGAKPDANELRAGQGLAEQFGYDVSHQPTASQLGVQGQRTADLTVQGVGQVDVYTPTTTNPTSITRAIEGKNTQAAAVLVQTSIVDADMAIVAARTWGKPTAQNIQTIFFQKPDGTIVRFNRPTGG
jgi:hypothetical protein